MDCAWIFSSRQFATQQTLLVAPARVETPQPEQRVAVLGAGRQLEPLRYL
jgi:hypothetical protein